MLKAAQISVGMHPEVMRKYAQADCEHRIPTITPHTHTHDIGKVCFQNIYIQQKHLNPTNRI